MPLSLTPARRRGVELLDEPHADPWLQRRSLADVALANRLFGGTRAVLAELGRVVDERVGGMRPGAPLSLLDVGTGIGDIPARAARLVARRGLRLEATGLDVAEAVVRASRAAIGAAGVLGDARALPFADRSVDVVACSQVLHHFPDDEAALVLREMTRVARRRVIVADLRRSWLAAAGIWAASFPLRFHPVSRHDGVTSVLRGYTPAELRAHVHAATGIVPVVRRHHGWRVTASWPPGAPASAA